MSNQEFKKFRKLLKKTQNEMAILLGLSIRAVNSYEQGWRNVPGHVERQMILLLKRKFNGVEYRNNCWDVLNCPQETKETCSAWEFQSGDVCWLVNGTACGGETQKNWKEKMKTCRECRVLEGIYKTDHEGHPN